MPGKGFHAHVVAMVSENVEVNVDITGRMENSSKATAEKTTAAAAGLILVMLGAIGKKIFVWHTGFWGTNTYGWHYELMLVVMNLVILFTDGGQYVLFK